MSNYSNESLQSLAAKVRRNPNCPDAQKALRVARFARSKELGLIVSPQDAELLWLHSWRHDGHGYAQTQINGNNIRLHQLVHSRMTGQNIADPKLYNNSRTVRHVENNNALDCRRENLYVKQSSRLNQRETNKRTRSDNTSGVSGVAWLEKSSKWELKLCVTGPNEMIRKGFGCYHSLDEATFVRNALIELRASFDPDTAAQIIIDAMLERRDALRAAWAELMTDADDFFTDEEAA